jgi:hypothetical protein
MGTNRKRTQKCENSDNYISKPSSNLNLKSLLGEHEDYIIARNDAKESINKHKHLLSN